MDTEKRKILFEELNKLREIRDMFLKASDFDRALQAESLISNIISMLN